MLFNEPKLLKFDLSDNLKRAADCFSALQRAEIAEISKRAVGRRRRSSGFSALQRAEIAEIAARWNELTDEAEVSVLFNEPKLLKSLARRASLS